MIVQLVVLLTRRVVNLVLFLSRRIDIVFMLLMNLMVLASLWRSLSISRRNLTMHASLKSLFLNFFAKCFLLFTGLTASVGNGSTQELEHHGVVVLDVEPRHLVHFGVDARVLPLHVGVVVAVLELAQRLLRLDIIGALESWCPEVD